MRGSRSWSVLGAILALAVSVTAQSDPAVRLQVRFADGRSQYHVGESVPLELRFTSDVPNTYYVSTRSYDRSGRLDIDAFHVTPAGRDPLRPYFDSLMAIMGGGLTGGPVMLSSEPHIVRAELNEWVALDHPGHYSLYVSSGRVLRRGEQTNQPIDVQSNMLEFDIIDASPEWQASALASIVSILNDPSATKEAKYTAVRNLRFLDSPASVRELVKQLGRQTDSSRWELMAGLYGSSHQELVLKELESLMAAPEVALTPEFLNLIARTKCTQAEGQRPPYPQHDESQQAAWRKEQEKRWQRFRAFDDAAYEQAAALVATKQGRARAETVRALLDRPTSDGDGVKPGAGLPEAEVAAAFEGLSADQQYEMLSIRWARIRLPVMADALEKLLAQPDLKHQLLRDIALQRLYELDPEAARPWILAEIKAPHVENGMFTVHGKTLGVLPEKTLPQFDDVLVSRLKRYEGRTTELDAELIGRYATVRILQQVKLAYESMPDSKNCRIADGLNTYFLRTDVEYGLRHVTDAMSACMSESFKMLQRIGRWNDVQPALIARMNSEDLWAARQAAEALALYGDEKAEKAMWARLRVFHDQWADRAKELQNQLGASRAASDAQGFQYGLAEALGRARAWVITDEQVTQLEGLTIGSEKQNVAQWHWHLPLPLNVTWAFDTVRTMINNQYTTEGIASLRAKLAQYPSGTRFLLTASGKSATLSAALKAIDEVAAEHGLVIERPSTESTEP